VAIGGLRLDNFSGKGVLVFFGTGALWQLNLSVLPDLGSEGRQIEVIQQAGNQMGDNNQHPPCFGLPDERDDVIGFRTFHGYWQIFAFIKKIRSLPTQTQSPPHYIQLNSAVFWSLQ
jgi:hypothetical protein